MIEKDLLWKSVLTDFFPEIIRFFYPKQSIQLDLSQTTYLDEVFDALFPQEKGIKNEISQLAQIPGSDGKPYWFLVHIVTEKPAEDGLQGRLFRQLYRILDQYDITVEIMVIFADSDPDFHPRRFYSKALTSQTSLDFGTYKLIDQKVRKLSSLQSPVSILLLIALESILNQDHTDEALLTLKLQLFRKILSNGYGISTIAKLTVFLQYYFSFENDDQDELFKQTILLLTESLEREFPELIRAEENRIKSLSQKECK